MPVPIDSVSPSSPQSVEELPKPTIQVRSRNHRRLPCPQCGRSCPRDKQRQRRLWDLGSLKTGRPHILEIHYSQHHCTQCGLYFPSDLSDLAPPKGDYHHRVMSLAKRLVIEDGMPYRTASWQLWRDHRVFVPFATIQNWVEGEGEKKER